jgi:hypothetical protein
MPRTIETTIYTFDELTGEAQKHAISELSDINVGRDWWDCVFDDAKQVGLKITEFDNYKCSIEFIKPPLEVAELIIKEHGEMCDTYKLAANYIKEIAIISTSHTNTTTGELTSTGEVLKEEANSAFLYALRVKYHSKLMEEYEYLTSAEGIRDTILCNEYEFTVNGDLV